MIVWMPGSGSIWSPHNVSSVWSRGVEINLKAGLHIQSIYMEVKSKYNHILSTNNTFSGDNDVTYGKQLFYVPKDNFQVQASFIYKGFNLTYIHAYTGERFTNNENTEYLRSFQTGNVNLSKNFEWKKYSVGFYAQVNNIWNEQYQVIAWRPMPGVNYQVGVQITI